MTKYEYIGDENIGNALYKTMDKTRIERVPIPYSGIAMLGLTILIVVVGNSPLVKRNDTSQPKSATIIYENRNEDALADRVLKYDDGSEQVLYAHQNEKGGLDYLTGEQHEK